MMDDWVVLQVTPSFEGKRDAARRISIGFLNWAHALDHYVMLIYPTAVIGLVAVYGRTYAELIALSTAGFVAFGLFSLPAGWLADNWSRRNMIAAFYFGCGASLVLIAFAPNIVMLTIALCALGMFAAIYHPVGMAMVIDVAVSRGRTLAFNGVCGNLGAALAAGITAALMAVLGWRGAFLVPAAICMATGIAYLYVVPNDRYRKSSRNASPDVALPGWVAIAIFALFVVVALCSGLVFNTISVALPKIVDERLGNQIPLIAVGGLATAVFMCGALAQMAVGRLVDRFPPHLLLAIIAALQLAGVLWSTYARGITLLIALAVTMGAIYGQVTVNDVVIARYTADAWRGRVYAVRYFLTFMVSGVAVSAMAYFYARGGFDLVLGATAMVALAFLVSVIAIAALVRGVERDRVPVPTPAE